MTCTHCGDSPISVRYRLRFDVGAARSTEIDLYLCDRCLSRFCAEPEIELVASPSALAGEPGE